MFLSHCLLNENTRYLGGACRPGAVHEVVQACLDGGLGIVQLPLVPHTVAVWVLVAARGVDSGPTFSGAGRVSIKRHGTIDTKADAPELPPPPNATCVTPMLAATMPPSTIARCALFMGSPFESWTRMCVRELVSALVAYDLTYF